MCKIKDRGCLGHIKTIAILKLGSKGPNNIMWRCWLYLIASELVGNIISSSRKKETFSEPHCEFAHVGKISTLCQRYSNNMYKTVCQRMFSQIKSPINSGGRAKGRWKSMLCTSYNSWFWVLREHSIRIPHWVFHPLCTAANLCPTCLEVIQLTKTFQSGGVFLGVVFLTCG